MKTILLMSLLFINAALSSQTIKPCEGWLTDYIQKEPKINDGTSIDKYVLGKLKADTSLRSMASCMVGLKIYTNCEGSYSYEKMEYPNKSSQKAQCRMLLKKTEHILSDVKLNAGTIDHQKKDFIFKLVVKVKHNGEPTAEILY